MRRAPLIHIVILTAFLVNTFGPMPAYAQPASPSGPATGGAGGDYRLPAPGVMVHLSPLFNPPILKGIKVHADNPFRFDFILDKGDSELSNDALKDESSKLIKYFLASLTIPEKDLWVNLSPYEKDRIIPQSFGLTEMGRDLLAEDYMLKQITASLIYPEDEIGKKFWKRVYEEAQKKYGTTNIPVNTFNKVWIVPEKAVVYENAKAGTAYVVESKLKVMLEEDYLSLEKHMNNNSLPLAGRVREGGIKGNTPPPILPPQGGGISALGSQIIREIVIPELTKEVNENKNFSPLRQVYNSLILAIWYKKKIKDSILARVYADKNKVGGVNIDDPQEKEKIYQGYLQAFKKGVYNYIKEESDPITQQPLPRKYFSGGENFAMTSLIMDAAMKSSNDTDFIKEAEKGKLVEVAAGTALFKERANLIPENRVDQVALEVVPRTGIFFVPDDVMKNITNGAFISITVPDLPEEERRNYITETLGKIRGSYQLVNLFSSIEQEDLQRRFFTVGHILIARSAYPSSKFQYILEHEKFHNILETQTDEEQKKDLEEAYQRILKNKELSPRVSELFANLHYGKNLSAKEFWAHWFHPSPRNSAKWPSFKSQVKLLIQDDTFKRTLSLVEGRWGPLAKDEIAGVLPRIRGHLEELSRAKESTPPAAGISAQEPANHAMKVEPPTLDDLVLGLAPTRHRKTTSFDGTLTLLASVSEGSDVIDETWYRKLGRRYKQLMGKIVPLEQQRDAPHSSADVKSTVEEYREFLEDFQSGISTFLALEQTNADEWKKIGLPPTIKRDLQRHLNIYSKAIHAFLAEDISKELHPVELADLLRNAEFLSEKDSVPVSKEGIGEEKIFINTQPQLLLTALEQIGAQNGEDSILKMEKEGHLIDPRLRRIQMGLGVDADHKRVNIILRNPGSIPAEKQGNLFKLNHDRPDLFRGGIGGSIALRAIERMGGTLSYRNYLDGDTPMVEFTVSFPAIINQNSVMTPQDWQRAWQTYQALEKAAFVVRDEVEKQQLEALISKLDEWFKKNGKNTDKMLLEDPEGIKSIVNLGQDLLDRLNKILDVVKKQRDASGPFHYMFNPSTNSWAQDRLFFDVYDRLARITSFKYLSEFDPATQIELIQEIKESFKSRFPAYRRMLEDILNPAAMDMNQDFQGNEIKGFPEDIYRRFLVPAHKVILVEQTRQIIRSLFTEKELSDSWRQQSGRHWDDSIIDFLATVWQPHFQQMMNKKGFSLRNLLDRSDKESYTTLIKQLKAPLGEGSNAPAGGFSTLGMDDKTVKDELKRIIQTQALAPGNNKQITICLGGTLPAEVKMISEWLDSALREAAPKDEDVNNWIAQWKIKIRAININTFHLYRIQKQLQGIVIKEDFRGFVPDEDKFFEWLMEHNYLEKISGSEGYAKPLTEASKKALETFLQGIAPDTVEDIEKVFQNAIETKNLSLAISVQPEYMDLLDKTQWSRLTQQPADALFIVSSLYVGDWNVYPQLKESPEMKQRRLLRMDFMNEVPQKAVKPGGLFVREKRGTGVLNDLIREPAPLPVGLEAVKDNDTGVFIKPDNAQTTGGIDFTANKTPLEVQNAGEGIKFRLDPAQLAQLQNAPGFVPVIINIQPMTDLRQFLGLADNQPIQQGASLK